MNSRVSGQCLYTLLCRKCKCYKTVNPILVCLFSRWARLVMLSAPLKSQKHSNVDSNTHSAVQGIQLMAQIVYLSVTILDHCAVHI